MLLWEDFFISLAAISAATANGNYIGATFVSWWTGTGSKVAVNDANSSPAFPPLTRPGVVYFDSAVTTAGVLASGGLGYCQKTKQTQ